MDQFFKLGERKSDVATELRAGLTTFLAMSYIIVVNPLILSAGGVPVSAAVTATCIGAAVMTIAMGLIANRPLACASGMGINSIVAYTLCGAMGLGWQTAMAIIFVEASRSCCSCSAACARPSWTRFRCPCATASRSAWASSSP